MIAQQDYHQGVNAYLRRELYREASYTHAYEMDPYTRIVYRRLRELYWTLSRLARPLRDGFFGKPKTQSFAFADGNAALQQAMCGEAPRIFIDATDLFASCKATGIQRVVRETSCSAAEHGIALPVIVRNGRLASAVRGAGVSDNIEPRAGDILLLLDAGWNHADDYSSAIDAFRGQGGLVVTALYDLFPLLYPSLFSRELVVTFQFWIEEVARQSDAVVAISRSTAESYAAYVKATPRKTQRAQSLGWWRLGADMIAAQSNAPDESVRRIAALGPFFLAVGTVEMRKGYAVALEAFERLWSEGVDANFVIVGGRGWNAAAFEQRLRAHKEKGRRLFWLDKANDADLGFLYARTRAVVLPTFAEGFGLPLVEAAHFGAPIIASDIPVFREIGGDDVRFFDVLDPNSLADRLRETLASEKVAPRIENISWRESTLELMTMLRNAAYQTRVP